MGRFASVYAGWTAGLLALSVLAAGPARGQEAPDASACCGLTTPAPVEFKRFYVGAAFNWTHHTGSIPDKPLNFIWNGNAKQYTAGGKAFVGYRFNENVHFETAYHYLGEVSIYEGSPILTREHSFAVSGSAVFLLSSVSQWLWLSPNIPIHPFFRFGLAYKDITQISPVATFREGILSGVFGAGLEFRLRNLFARVEYEFISTAIGGRPQEVPVLNGLARLTFGGTRHVVNVMNTPLALTLGAYF